MLYQNSEDSLIEQSTIALFAEWPVPIICISPYDSPTTGYYDGEITFTLPQ